MLADNAFGRPYCVEVNYLSYLGGWWGGWTDARTLANGVSAFLVSGCHAIDAMRWFALPTVVPDSSNVSHHPFQAEIDHFVECANRNRPSHCNLDDAIKTHEIAFAAIESANINQPVRLAAVQ